MTNQYNTRWSEGESQIPLFHNWRGSKQIISKPQYPRRKNVIANGGDNYSTRIAYRIGSRLSKTMNRPLNRFDSLNCKSVIVDLWVRYSLCDRFMDIFLATRQAPCGFVALLGFSTLRCLCTSGLALGVSAKSAFSISLTSDTLY